MKSFVGGRVTITLSDITREAVDAAVNAANGSLMGGGGVDGAIHRAGGPGILAACKQIRATRYPDGLPTGEAVITTAGRMPARYVIHTVGPVYRGGNSGEAGKLANCYRNAISIAAERKLATLAFPAISTGVYGYPSVEAAAVSSQAIERALDAHPSIREVRLVFFRESDAETFLRHQVFTR
ncbi:MAG: O-acetyl-ADP-ribose deacetylase [Gammaproteobacteria bacterium]|nr:O-acetyl-ADP-ribose deacetylase [Gammaproteobacteria bacterium]